MVYFRLNRLLLRLRVSRLTFSGFGRRPGLIFPQLSLTPKADFTEESSEFKLLPQTLFFSAFSSFPRSLNWELFEILWFGFRIRSSNAVKLVPERRATLGRFHVIVADRHLPRESILLPGCGQATSVHCFHLFSGLVLIVGPSLIELLLCEHMEVRTVGDADPFHLFKLVLPSFLHFKLKRMIGIHPLLLLSLHFKPSEVITFWSRIISLYTYPNQYRLIDQSSFLWAYSFILNLSNKSLHLSKEIRFASNGRGHGNCKNLYQSIKYNPTQFKHGIQQRG